MDKTIQKGFQELYNWDFDHALDHRDGLDAEEQEDDLSWLDDFERQLDAANVSRILDKYLRKNPWMFDFAKSMSAKAQKGLAMILEEGMKERHQENEEAAV
jgi:hypothetical protein